MKEKQKQNLSRRKMEILIENENFSIFLSNIFATYAWMLTMFGWMWTWSAKLTVAVVSVVWNIWHSWTWK